MIKKLQNFNFSVSLFKVCLVEFTFVNDFDGDLKVFQYEKNVIQRELTDNVDNNVQSQTALTKIYLLTSVFVILCLASFTTAKFPLPMVFSIS